ncbi:hypothetical protein ACIU1J_11310 [Azospirillum doebereinerae]|uniref:hypothetical protein n=1 Tax=Azospirillum doebereinerae TaxID=92933 RepID=UPI00384CC7D8
MQLIEIAHQNVYSGAGLVALMNVRAIFETVACFLHFEKKLHDLLKEDDLQKIHDFVHARTLATRLPHLIEKAGTDQVQAMSVLTQIDQMTKVRPDARKEYDHLCEYTHPNALGGFLYFGKHDVKADVVTFSDAGPEPEDDLKWVLVGGHVLSHFLDALGRIEAELPRLSDLARSQRSAQS